jgi:hypothetical protein
MKVGVEHVAGRAAPAEPEAVARSIEATEGELRFTLALPESEHELWIRTSSSVTPPADAAAVASLLPAMAAGAGALRVEAPVGEATLDSMREAQAVLRSWARSGAWLRALPFDREIALRAPVAEVSKRLTGGPVAAFFSGGVDSLSTVGRHPEITHLIHVVGFDTTAEQTELNDAVRERLGAAADELGKQLVTVETNLRQMSDRYLLWPVYFGSALGAVSLCLSGAFSRLLIAGGNTYGTLYENGSHPLLDRLWGADRVEVVHDGAAFTRTEKLEQLAGDATARRVLRVCWRNPQDSYNCGRCEKCLRTMVALEVLGVRDRFPTLDGELDLEEVAAIRPENRPEAEYWRDNLALAVREQAAPELIAAIERCIVSAEPEAQLTAGAPGRRRVADPRLATPCLYMRPETHDMLEASRAIAFLVGGCDGWANFGDVAQLQATADLFAELDPALAALAVIDPRAHASWPELGLRPAGGFDPAHPVYFAQPVDGLDHLVAELGLVPVGIPERVRAAATWLYGGGYLNRRWGRRKLLMAGATEALCRRWGVTGEMRLSSGLQIEPEWLRRLDPELRELLARFDPLGVRDELSAQAPTELGGAAGAAGRLTGDDAVGLLARLRPRDRERRSETAPRVINLHVCPGDWVNADAASTIRYLERFVGALTSEPGPGLMVQPLVAYDDPTVLSERPALAELTAAITSGPGGVVVAEPTPLSVAGLDRAAEVMRRADLTVSCSYHVALTSLVLEVPAVLVRSDLYYGQKADGLRRDFSLPSELFPHLEGDPESAAAAATRTLGLGENAPGLALAAGRERVLRRRAELERELGDALATLLEPADTGARPPVVPVADYEALLVALRHAHERADAHVADTAWYRARLSDIENSASWRLTGAARNAKRRLRFGRSPR